jgi:hypothetical protein
MELGKQIRTAAVSAALLAASLALPAKDVLPPSTGGVAPQSGPASPLTDKPSGLPTLVVAPADLRIEDLSQGCYVFLYDRTHFDGTRLNIIGPVEMRTMEAPFGARFNKLKSAVVGPRARAIAYDDTNFGNRELVMESGGRIADFREEWGKGKLLGFFEGIKSLRVLCQP